MKIFLILLNILLFSGVIWTFLSRTGMPAADSDEYFIRRKPGSKKKASAAAIVKKQEKTAPAITNPTAVVTEHNMFDPARCPNARVPGRNRNNTRLEMKLVGTFTIGDISGAVILQKKQQNQQNNMPFPRPPGPGMMQPGNNNNNNNNNNNRGAFRQRFGPGGPMPPWMMNNQDNTTENQNVVYKQYVRVGETMANGYTLVSVTRTSATLTKNSEHLELEILQASENMQGSTANKNQTNNVRQNNMPLPPPMMGGGMPGGMGGGMPGGMGGGRMPGGPNPQNNNRGGGRPGNNR